MLTTDETVRDFLIESQENLDQIDRELLALEADPSAKQHIAAVFRTIHTVKGTSGFLGFSQLEKLAHAGETLLAQLRDGAFSLTPPMASALLLLVDKIRAILRDVEATGREGTHDCEELIARLGKLAAQGGSAVAAPAVVQPTVSPAPETPALSGNEAQVRPTPAMSKPAVAVVHAPEVPVDAAAHLAGDSSTDGAAAPERAVPAASDPAGSVADSSVRVDVGLLDKLMNLVGELVLARNQILQFGAKLEDASFVAASQRLNLITTELQESVMKTRMQPIGNVWNKLPRVVRDVAAVCHKQVRVEMNGKDTELDRTIVEAIKDPLTHIVRNAVDHGIEAPDVRASLGKPRTGKLALRAFHEGGQVNIEISDDGGGINPAIVRRNAVQNGLITAERAARMSDREACQLVFVPGFSTAAKVTNVSGRGVGMDVVKTNIEKIGGVVDLQSSVGVGTTLRIKIPLTLAIVPALVVSTCGHRFAIPQVSLLELVRLEGATAREGIETIHGAPVYRLRGNLLPLVRLDAALGLRPASEPASADGAINIVVLQADDRQFGLVVDDIRDTEEIVVKPLGKELKHVNVFAGATIMGDGCVALILDVLGLAHHARAIAGVRGRTALDAVDRAATAESKGAERRQNYLVFRVGTDGRMAMPLSMVARLEEFEPARLERVGRRFVVQYRGEILPLLDVADALGAGSAHSDERHAQVVVFSEQGRSMGLVVQEIVDIVNEEVDVQENCAGVGTTGAAVIQGRVTDLLDVRAVIRGFDPSFFREHAA